MAMTSGGGGGAMGDINVTPMIDILLVLLIIFMVIVPVTPKGLDALVPQPPKNPQKQNDDQRAIVVQVEANKGGEPTFKINETPFAKSELQQKLTDIFATRAERVMFVKGDDNVDFRYIADVIDIGYAANVQHVGLMTPKILAGQ
jgi:biopolymer transport protein TolR